ncbi:hypothetical protein IE53DRAFT_34330 [Violaceomyces palustris]|uniref:Uncharacterized protein n=1 Tax=Violaceomyces palustris TaxID=1673888 RepID=A0ACD0P1A0_9BASI|nr:hypothetical protein IE53DRAFT_34330 [Violaceomyces palustris]
MKAFSNPTQGENTWLGSGGSPVQHQRERDQHFSNLNFGHSGQASHPSNNAPSSSSSFINTTNTNDTTSPSNTSDYPTNLSSPPNTGLDPSSLAPIGNRYGISPGAISDFSNEAQGGHSGSIGTSIFGTSADSPLAQYQLYSIPNPPGTHGGEGGGGSQIPTYPTSQHASSVSNSRNKNSIGSSGNSNSTTTTSNYPGPSGGLKESQNFLESMSTDHLGGGGHGNEQQQQQPLTRASFQSLRSSMDQSRPSPVYDHDDLQAITGGIRGVGISGHQQNSNSIDSPTAANRIGGGGSGGGVVGAGSASYGGSGLIPSSSNSFSCDTSNGTYVNSSVGAGMAQTPSGGSLSAHLSAPTMEEIVPTTFDEGMLRALCDMDCGMPLLFDRIKQSMVSAREASTFLKKRAAIEEEYARNLSKLTRATMEAYSIEGGKAG